MSYADAKLAEIDRNLEMFLQLLPSLVAEHKGEYALLRRGAVVEYHQSAPDAQIAGNRRFADRMFSIQQITDEAVELRRYSYAVR